LRINHTNTYELEENKDKLLNTIKMLCFMYLEKLENINHISTQQLKNYFIYISSEYSEISTFRESLKVKTYHQPYKEIFSNLDGMISSDNLLSKDERITFVELTKDVNYLEDTLAFCYGVLSKTINERENI
jgi:hypothetical protein